MVLVVVAALILGVAYGLSEIVDHLHAALTSGGSPVPVWRPGA